MMAARTSSAGAKRKGDPRNASGWALGCPANEPYAQPGSYKLTGRNGTVTSAPASRNRTATA